MKISSAAFIKSALHPDQFVAANRPEVAFVGRSNVGKSTLLNTLLGRKGLAKVSKTPGKTRTVNFFDVNNRYYFVDLPGYGFAKVSQAMQQQWGRAITAYLARESLRLVVHLMDARHGPTPKDLNLLALTQDAEVPTLLVATKVDKLKRSERDRLEKVFQEALGFDDDVLIIAYSSVTREGLSELWEVIGEQLGG